jgi:ATP-dependent exoDNAse (exonuclease V) beta subunit
MTVHRAKGLEFPVVILADMTARETPVEPQRHVDAERGLCAMRIASCSPSELLDNADAEMTREREEATRLLYVAATRARDLLVVPVLGDQLQLPDDQRFAGWLSALDPAVYPAPERATRPEAREVPGAPPFGSDSVLVRPPNLRRTGDAVAPGFHRPELGEHRVVWWDPAALVLGAREAVGLRQQRLLAADEGGARAEESVVAHARWRASREEVRDAAATPSVRIATPSAEGMSLDTAGLLRLEVAVESATAPARSSDGARPHGKRFGALVHAILAAIPFDAKRGAIAAACALHGRVLGASEAEIAGAVDVVRRALGHPLLARAARAAGRGACRRETPISLPLDGVIVEGVVDVAFEDEEGGPPGWTVVDFKTDVELAGRIEEYTRQVELYALAIAHATGKPARGVLLRL